MSKVQYGNAMVNLGYDVGKTHDVVANQSMVNLGYGMIGQRINLHDIHVRSGATNVEFRAGDGISLPKLTLEYVGPDMNHFLNGVRTPAIVNVIFNDPATIVFWADGTKTVVKRQAPDKKKKFDKEKGLAMAIAKKALGNHGNYFETFKKWCE